MPNETFVQPSLQELAARLLTGQADAHASGVASFRLDEVTPYEAGPVQPIDPQLAWREAQAALAHYQPQANRETADQAPPHWAQLVASHEPVVALPFCVGNFPQLVRNFHQVLQTRAPALLRTEGGRAVNAPQLITWAHEIAARKEFPAVVLALGALRLAKQFDEADRFVAALEGTVPPAWHPAWDNEKAALAWARGDAAGALQQWSRAAALLPVRFNRAMAELFAGDPQAARPDLDGLVKELPETSAWHHLARLYLTLATMR